MKSTVILREKGDPPDSAFAFPKERKEPLTDAQHVRNAVARFDQVIDVSDEERALAFANIEKAADYYGVDAGNVMATTRRSSAGASQGKRARRRRNAHPRARRWIKVTTDASWFDDARYLLLPVGSPQLAQPIHRSSSESTPRCRK